MVRAGAKRLISSSILVLLLREKTIFGFVSVFHHPRIAPEKCIFTAGSITSNKLKSETILRMACKKSHYRTLSRDEELDLLRQATELRRLQKHEQDLVLQNPKKTIPLLSIRSKSAGYGDDLDGYEAAIKNGHEARETLVTCNMGLVRHCAKEMIRNQPPSKLGSLSQEDLIQEGAIGLARAVDKYNIGIGGKFSTYSYYWIRAAMLRCIAERGEVVRVPENVSTAVRKMSAAANKLGLSIDGETIVRQVSTSREWKEAQVAKAIAEEAGLTDSQLRQALRVRSRRRAGHLSFEDWMQRGRDLKSDVTHSLQIEETSFDSEKLEDEFSKYLRPKEMEALSLRYGLRNKELERGSVFAKDGRTPQRGKSGEAMSFNEVGRSMSVSAEYGRRLVHNALAKLRKAADDGHLEAAFLF